ncbi:hypothetical protein JMN32_18980 [Fulvivirga sp. 29W222]|uniref:Uncharacterized protein n=1 Tax=Fulvivirga marina TaxID=2494733 RepID=A0A937FYD6_9BACT|nr:hypothetical protein [Fulvivirga marina]MBL6448405.1 hypothetical protein [Fulvivirga marina]
MQRRHKYFKLRALRRSRRGLLTTAILLVAAVIFAVLFTYEKLIHYYAYDLLGKTLKRTVELKTDGFYSISYDSIHVDFVDSRATLFNFKVDIDSVQLDASDKDMSLFVAHVPRVDADIINLLEVVFKDRLSLKTIILQQPEVWIAQPRQDEENIGLSKESGDIYKTVTQQIREFNLGSFGLSQAKISYKRDLMERSYDFVTGNISFLIRNFGWDSDSNNDPKFHSDHISLLVKDQTFKLKDSVHLFSFDSVLLSTRESRIELTNVHLYPRNDAVRKGKDLDRNAYSIGIPSLSLRGVDFNKAYMDNVLSINEIDIRSPNFAMDNFLTVAKNTPVDPSTEELVKIITQLFNIIEISNLNIDNGGIDVLRDRAFSSSRFKANNIFAHVKNVRIDTLNYSAIKYDSATVGLKNYYYSMPDSIHILKFGSLSFVTTDKSNIRIDSLKVFDRLTLSEKIDHGGVINIDAPQVRVSGFEFENFIDNNQLVMNNVSIERPEIRFHMEDTAYSTSGEIDLPELVGAIFDFLHTDSINLNDGEVSLMRKGAPFIEFHGLGTSVGEVVNGKGRSNLYLDSLQMKVSARSIVISPPESVKGRLTGVSLVQNDKTKLTIRRVEIEGNEDVPINASLAGVFVPLPGVSVFLNSPSSALNGLRAREFKLLVDKSFLQKKPENDQSESFSFKRIHLGKGIINIVGNKAPVFTANVNYLKFREFLIHEDEKPEVKGLELSLAGSSLYGDGSVLTFSQLQLSEKLKQLAVKKLEVKGKHEFLIDTISSNGIEVGRLVNENILDAKMILARNTNIQLSTKGSDKPKTTTHFLDLQQKLNEYIKDIKVDRLILANTTFDNRDGVVAKGVNFDIRGVRIAPDRKWNYKIPFAQRMAADAENVSITNNQSSVVLTGVTLDSKTDALGVNRFSFTNKEDATTFKVPGIHMSIPDIYAFVNHQKVDIQKVKLIKPDITLQQREDKSAGKNLLEGSDLKAVSIHNLDLSNGSVLLKREGKGDFKLKDISINLKQVLLDERTNLNKDVLVFKGMTATVPNLSFKTKDGLNTITVEKVAFALKDSSLTVSNLRFVPLSQFEYFDKKHFESDWINASAGTIKLSGLHLDKFLNQQLIDSRHLLIDNAKIDVYRDKNMPDAPAKEKTMYHVAFGKYKKPVNIGRVDIHNTDITYTEFAEGALQPGSVSFEEFSAVFKNVTNRESLLKKNRFVTMDATAMVMGKAKLDLSMSFDMLSPAGAFTIGGKLAATPLRIFNDITVYNANIDIREGYANSLFFSARANEDVAYGTMEFRYEDLKIYILEKPSERTSRTNKSIASFFANTFVINKNNPHLFKFREGKIYFERNPNKSLFNYWTKTFLSGLVASIGVNNNKKEFDRVTSDEEQEK